MMPKMPRRLQYASIGLIFLLLFALFSFLVKEDLLVQFDFDTTVRLQNNISRRFDTFLSYFSVLGSIEVTTLALLVLLAIRRKVDGFFIIFGFGMFLLIELFGKIVVDHPGPPYLFARYKSLVDFPTHYIPQPSGAYPSGHSGRTVFLAILFLFMVFKEKSHLISPLRIAFFVGVIGFVSIMLLSRIVLGEHWTTDVIGGTLLATSMAFFTLAMLQNKKKIVKEIKG